MTDPAGERGLDAPSASDAAGGSNARQLAEESLLDGEVDGIRRCRVVVPREVALAPAPEFAVETVKPAFDREHQPGLVPHGLLEVLAIYRPHHPPAQAAGTPERRRPADRDLRGSWVSGGAHRLQERRGGVRRTRRKRLRRPGRRVVRPAVPLRQGRKASDIAEIPSARRAEHAHAGGLAAEGADARARIHAQDAARPR